MGLTSHTGLLAIASKQNVAKQKMDNTEPPQLKCQVVPAPFMLRPYAGLYNPFSNACSVLCNHPADTEAKEFVKRAKDAWALEGKTHYFQEDLAKFHDAQDKEKNRTPHDIVTEDMFRRYTETDSRPLTPAPTLASGKSRGSRRCLTPDQPHPRTTIVLDLRRSHSQETLYYHGYTTSDMTVGHATSATNDRSTLPSLNLSEATHNRLLKGQCEQLPPLASPLVLSKRQERPPKEPVSVRTAKKSCPDLLSLPCPIHPYPNQQKRYENPVLNKRPGSSEKTSVSLEKNSNSYEEKLSSENNRKIAKINPGEKTSDSSDNIARRSSRRVYSAYAYRPRARASPVKSVLSVSTTRKVSGKLPVLPVDLIRYPTVQFLLNKNTPMIKKRSRSASNKRARSNRSPSLSKLKCVKKRSSSASSRSSCSTLTSSCSINSQRERSWENQLKALNLNKPSKGKSKGGEAPASQRSRDKGDREGGEGSEGMGAMEEGGGGSSERRRGKRRRKGRPVGSDRLTSAGLAAQTQQDPETQIAGIGTDSHNPSSRGSVAQAADDDVIILPVIKAPAARKTDSFLDDDILKYLHREVDEDAIETEFDVKRRYVLEEAWRTRPERSYGQEMQSLLKELKVPAVSLGDWLHIPRVFSRQNAQFTLPIDSNALETLSPIQYAARFVTLKKSKQLLYLTVLRKFRPDGYRMPIKDIQEGLILMMGGILSVAQAKQFKSIMEWESYVEEENIPDEIKLTLLNTGVKRQAFIEGGDDGELINNTIKYRTWCGLCAICERMYGRFPPRDKDPPDGMELSDFTMVETKLAVLKVHSGLVEILNAIRMR